MENPDEFIAEVERYCEAADIAPTTLGLRALNNARFFQRFVKRRESEGEAVSKLRSFMAANPPKKESAA